MVSYPVSAPRPVVTPQTNMAQAGPKDMNGEVIREGLTVARAMMMMGRTPYIKKMSGHEGRK